MDAHNIPSMLFKSEARIADPGASGNITVDKTPATCNLVSATTETRTMIDPTREGAEAFLYMLTDGGDITVTFSTAFTEDGATTFVFSEVGQWLLVKSIRVSASALAWRKISDYALANFSIADSEILDDLSGLTATVAELNQAADESANTELVTTTNGISASESGKTFFLDNATGFVSTLPAAAIGLRFTFIIKTAVTTTGGHTIVCPAAAALFKGTVLTCDVNSATDSDFGVSGEATITFVINKAIASDRVDLICDGTSWHFRASCTVFDAITVS